jgi:3'-phosphoadenosine 5'-phosphosulfate sulfotransferase (PAPS reductase)/FAD synthetase
VKLVQVVGAPLPLPARFQRHGDHGGPASPEAGRRRRPLVEPTDAEVDLYHAAYVAALVELFDQHKAACGCADKTLNVV